MVQALELEALKRSTTSAKSSPFWHRAGEVCEVELGDDDAALALFRKDLYDLDRTLTRPALASPGRLHYKAGRFEDLLETYQLRELRILAQVWPSVWRRSCSRWASCTKSASVRTRTPIISYRKAIEMDPFNQQALHALGSA